MNHIGQHGVEARSVSREADPYRQREGAPQGAESDPTSPLSGPNTISVDRLLGVGESMPPSMSQLVP